MIRSALRGLALRLLAPDLAACADLLATLAERGRDRCAAQAAEMAREHNALARRLMVASIDRDRAQAEAHRLTLADAEHRRARGELHADVVRLTATLASAELGVARLTADVAMWKTRTRRVEQEWADRMDEVAAARRNANARGWAKRWKALARSLRLSREVARSSRDAWRDAHERIAKDWTAMQGERDAAREALRLAEQAAGQRAREVEALRSDLATNARGWTDARAEAERLSARLRGRTMTPENRRVLEERLADLRSGAWTWRGETSELARAIADALGEDAAPVMPEPTVPACARCGATEGLRAGCGGREAGCSGIASGRQVCSGYVCADGPLCEQRQRAAAPACARCGAGGDTRLMPDDDGPGYLCNDRPSCERRQRVAASRGCARCGITDVRMVAAEGAAAAWRPHSAYVCEDAQACDGRIDAAYTRGSGS